MNSRILGINVQAQKLPGRTPSRILSAPLADEISDLAENSQPPGFALDLSGPPEK
jgi:hypothetical protein